jgi:prepilin-type N-terminal cleavage/methylation domain-containing protein
MRRQGFTLAEVMVSLGVMTIGAMALIGMQVQTSRANTRARDLTTATQIAQNVIERLKMDALAWNSVTGNPATDLSNTQLLKNVTTATVGAFMTLPGVSVTSPDGTRVLSNAFDYYGDDVNLSGASSQTQAGVRYCASYRLSWIFANLRALRADVRVWWTKEAPSRSIIADFANCADDNVALNPGGDQVSNYHVIYLSTVVRPN